MVTILLPGRAVARGRDVVEPFRHAQLLGGSELRDRVPGAGTSLFVPTTSVVRTSERQFVVRLRNGAAEWVDVRRGQADGDLVEVFGELREGDVVARRGNDEIRPGTRVGTAASVNR